MENEKKYFKLNLIDNTFKGYLTYQSLDVSTWDDS